MPVQTLVNEPKCSDDGPRPDAGVGRTIGSAARRGAFTIAAPHWPRSARSLANKENKLSNAAPTDVSAAESPSREQLAHSLYEAAELEHCILCIYLYAAFSLKQGVAEGLTAQESEAVARWQRVLIDVAVEEMGHTVAVWNLTSALGLSPRIGRQNFPLDERTKSASAVML